MNLTDLKIWPTATDLPDMASHLRMWQDDVHGVGAVVAAVRELLAGKAHTIHFVVAKQGGEVIQTYGFGIGKAVKDKYRQATVRYVGERNDPDGNGSHALMGPRPDNDQLAPDRVAASIVHVLAAQSAWFWRIQP